MKRFLFWAIIFWSSHIFASNHVYHNKLNRCTPTKSFINDYEPENFESTNNLLRKTGQIPKYTGEKILVRGRVLDQNCVPVSDAKVYLWQTNANGKYPYTPLRDRVNKNMLTIDKKSSFTGSGIATTNNNGEYYFITIFPRSLPYINIRVEHYDLSAIQTKFHLSSKNICGNQCAEMNSSLLAAEGDIPNYCLDVVLHGTGLKSY